ncbi:MAG: response regulator [Myxococcales bacterium]|nr:response regulator [Myxococcales bacterium]MBL8719956.1 response regulator [Myxococcales bacterium]
MNPIQTALVIDADETLVNHVLTGLRKRGLEARWAKGPTDAQRVLRESPADLILIDLFNPSSWGLVVLEQVRKAAPGAVLAVVTAQAEIPLVVQSMRLGADLFMSKPADLDRLLADALAVHEQPRPDIQAASVDLPTLNLDQLERLSIARALEKSGGIVRRAARMLGIDRRTLQRKLRQLDR